MVGGNILEFFVSCPHGGRGKYFGGFVSCPHGGRGKHFGGVLAVCTVVGDIV